MKKPPSIDTLRYAQKLEDNGMNRDAATAMAQALNEELADRLLTKADIRDELAPIQADIRDELVPIHAKLSEFDQRFATIDGKFDAVDARFDAVDARFDAMDAKFDASLDAMDAKFDAKIGSLSWRLTFGFSTMFLVLSLLVALGVFQVMRTAPAPSPAAVVAERSAELPPGR